MQERKLEMIRLLRDEQQNNRTAMSRREQILYPYKKENGLYETNKKADESMKTNMGGFIFRLLFSIAIFLGYFYLDYSHESLYSVDAKMIQDMTTQEFTLKSFDFTVKFPYTLIDKQ